MGKFKSQFKIMGNILRPLAFMYIIWGILSVLVLQAGQFIPDEKSLTHITGPVSILFFLTLASLLTAVYIVYVEPFLQNHQGIRKILLVMTLLLSIGLFAFVRWTGSTYSLISVINTANLLVFANLLGTWIVTPLKRPAELLPLCIVMSMADLFSVISGPSSKIAETIEEYYESGMEGPAPIGDFILIKFAVPGLEHPMPIFGLSDWIIVAFLTASAARFSMNDNLAGKSMETMVNKRQISLYLPVTVLGLMTAIFIAHYQGLFLPALPVIAVFFLLYTMVKYPCARELTRSDMILVLISSGVMAGLMAVRYYVF